MMMFGRVGEIANSSTSAIASGNGFQHLRYTSCLGREERAASPRTLVRVVSMPTANHPGAMKAAAAA